MIIELSVWKFKTQRPLSADEVTVKQRIISPISMQTWNSECLVKAEKLKCVFIFVSKCKGGNSLLSNAQQPNNAQNMYSSLKSTWLL